MVDISTQIGILSTSKEGNEIKQAIWEALYILSQYDPNHIVGYNIDQSNEFVWGITPNVVIGVAEEVTV